MAKLKKDGLTPKLSGGSRGGGRPIKNIVSRKYSTIYLDDDLHSAFCKLSADEKNEVVKNGLSLRS
jgi:hypothetical protein